VNNVSIRIDLGSVKDTIGELKFSFEVQPDGYAYIVIYGHDPSDRRKAGIYLALGQNGFEQLKYIIRRADGVIDDFLKARQMRRQTFPRGNDADT
jgi:hypothetical protein